MAELRSNVPKTKEWWTGMVVPYLVVMFGTSTIAVLRHKLDKNLIEKAEATNNYYGFSLQALTPEQFHSTLYDVIGLTIIFILLLCCALAFLRQLSLSYAERYSVTRWFVKWSSKFTNHYFLIIF